MPLMSVFATVPDPRARRGVRHALPMILTVAAGAVLAGAKSLVAVSEWAADADRDALSQLGIDPSVLLPSESTIRRTLATLDADDLDARLGAWLATRVRRVGERTVVAVDGKSLRGARVAGVMPHLLATLEHEHGVVLGQRAVPDKGSEIAALQDLLAPMDLAGVVVTADALHCQRDTATWLTERGADYVLTVLCRWCGYAEAVDVMVGVVVGQQGRAVGSAEYRHSYRLSRKARTVSEGRFTCTTAPSAPSSNATARLASTSRAADSASTRAL